MGLAGRPVTRADRERAESQRTNWAFSGLRFWIAAGPLVIRRGIIYTWIEDDLDVPYVVRAPVQVLRPH